MHGRTLGRFARFALPVVLVASGVSSLAGCGGGRGAVLASTHSGGLVSDPPATATTTATATTRKAALTGEQQAAADALAAALSSSDDAPPLAPSARTCVGETVARTDGVARTNAIAKAVADSSSSVPIADARAFVDAVAGCAPLREVEQAAVRRMGVSDEAAACTVAKLSDRELVDLEVSSYVDETEQDAAMRELVTRAGTVVESCLPRDEAVELVARSLLRDDRMSSLMTTDAATCTARAVVDEVGVRRMVQLASSPELDLSSARSLAAALLACTDVRTTFARGVVQSSGADATAVPCVAKVIPDAELRDVLAKELAGLDSFAAGEALGRKYAADFLACGLVPRPT